MTRVWTNWAGNQQARPLATEAPRDVGELLTIIDRAAESGRRVKAVGAGHSFTGVAVTDGVSVALDKLAGIESVAPCADGTSLVTVGAGTRLHDLGPALWERGLAMTNLGDIDVQTVAGALSTGTHGTGARVGGIASQVVAARIALADGGEVDATGDLLEAARLGLGALGVLTAVTLRCEPAFLLRATEAPGRLDETLERFAATNAAVDHHEFYWFPHTDRILTKANVRLPATEAAAPLGRVRGWIDDELLSNSTFEILNRIGAARPSAIPAMNRLAARALSARTFTDRSYRVFASSRRVRFREMEYAVPVEHVPGVLTEIRRWLDRSDYRVAFPVEVRCAAADDVWLSTAHGRATGYVAVHQYHRREPGTYFDAVEKIAVDAGGRPHWGKLHTRGADELRASYPQFDNFVAVRDKVDPGGMFANAYLESVLGPRLL
ncbi:D-arabinono-1,4-lactone oxidase [Actinomycetes bacterium M1A6_2h]